jgi:hypothetical protein
LSNCSAGDQLQHRRRVLVVEFSIGQTFEIEKD